MGGIGINRSKRISTSTVLAPAVDRRKTALDISLVHLSPLPLLPISNVSVCCTRLPAERSLTERYTYTAY